MRIKAPVFPRSCWDDRDFVVDHHRNVEPSQAKGIIALEPETVSWSRVSTTQQCDCCRLLSPHLAAGKQACRQFNLPCIFIVSRMLRRVMWNRGRPCCFWEGLVYFSKHPADVTTPPGLCWSFTGCFYFLNRPVCCSLLQWLPPCFHAGATRLLRSGRSWGYWTRSGWDQWAGLGPQL